MRSMQIRCTVQLAISMHISCDGRNNVMGECVSQKQHLIFHWFKKKSI